MTDELKIMLGFGLCITGLVIAVLTLVPAIVPPGGPPWPIFIGSAIYLPGSFLVFFTAKGQKKNVVFNKIRLIRLGFLVVVAIVMTQILRS